MQDAEAEYAYENPNKKSIFEPIYSGYNEVFLNEIEPGLKVQDAFEALDNTNWWEQYLINNFQFSAAKSAAEMKTIQQKVYDENGNKRSFDDFKEIINSDQELFNETWLRTEYDLAAHGAVMAEQWQNIWKDRDLYPVATFKTQEDDRVREEHEELDNFTFLIDSGEADALYPPLDWNCRCYWETGDDTSNLTDTDELNDYINKNIPEDFQHNVGRDGIFPIKGSSYQDVIPNANDVSPDMFEGGIGIELTQLNSKVYNEYQVKCAINEWFGKKDLSQDVIFRNHEWKLNIRLPHELLQKLAKKAQGFENIRKTIENPSEIWGKWKDTKKQRGTLLKYISTDGKRAYVVETENGVVKDAYFLQHADSKNLRRQGVKFVRG